MPFGLGARPAARTLKHKGTELLLCSKKLLCTSSHARPHALTHAGRARALTFTSQARARWCEQKPTGKH
eukprot:6188453-Pleurochrysis_carterae.AAC.3